jgi:hypothetical protein
MVVFNFEVFFNMEFVSPVLRGCSGEAAPVRLA